MKRTIGIVALAFACVSLASVSADASTISIRATSFTAGTNALDYIGLGDLGGSVGHGRYSLGACSFDGTRTNCVVSGNYVEVAGSQFNPGATGFFTFTESWLGNVANPIEARSDAPNSNTLIMHAEPPGTFFSLQLSNGFRGARDFGAQDTPNPQNGILNWQSFSGTPVSCTGPAACNIGAVGLSNTSTYHSTLSPFDMQISFDVNPAPVPEPGTWMLLGTGLAALVARRLRK